MNNNVILDMKNITLVYPNGVVANRSVNFQATEGEIHALMGENGAGKTTLMKILFGIEKPTTGEIWIKGQNVQIESPMHAIKLGVGMVHQHFMLVPSLTVTENIILGMEPKKAGLIDFDKARELVVEAGKKYNFLVNPDERIVNLDVGKKQKVEILKALIRGAKILILDEPTAVLTPQETQELFEQLRKLREDGHTIIFISHKINEIKDICDRITILRSGQNVGLFQVQDVSKEDISRIMIGREVVTFIDKKTAEIGEPVLKVKDLLVINSEGNEVVKSISMSVPRGKILGIAGVEGNGQREFVDCITGLLEPNDGTVEILGKSILGKSIRFKRNAGMSHIPEDRMTYGVAVDENIEDNLVSDRYHKKKYQKGLLLNHKRIQKETENLVQEFIIKTDSPKTQVKMLSGGNIQKVVAAREMSSNPEILIADQPTRGIDVGAAAFIHQKIIELRDAGKAILLISADINEVLALSDSLAVFYDGEIGGYFKDAKNVTEEELGLYMLGLKKMSREEIQGVAL